MAFFKSVTLLLWLKNSIVCISEIYSNILSWIILLDFFYLCFSLNLRIQLTFCNINLDLFVVILSTYLICSNWGTESAIFSLQKWRDRILILKVSVSNSKNLISWYNGEISLQFWFFLMKNVTLLTWWNLTYHLRFFSEFRLFMG